MVLKSGDRVTLKGFCPGCIVPDGEHVVSKVNVNGSFHVGGNTAVWPDRIVEREAKTPMVGVTDERFA